MHSLGKTSTELVPLHATLAATFMNADIVVHQNLTVLR